MILPIVDIYEIEHSVEIFVDNLLDDMILDVDIISARRAETYDDSGNLYIDMKINAYFRQPARIKIKGKPAKILNIKEGTIIDGFYEGRIMLSNSYLFKTNYGTQNEEIEDGIYIDGYAESNYNWQFSFDHGSKIFKQEDDTNNDFMFDLKPFEKDHYKLFNVTAIVD